MWVGCGKSWVGFEIDGKRIQVSVGLLVTVNVELCLVW